MTDAIREEQAQEASLKESFLPSSRRTFFKSVAGAGAAVSLVSKVAWANGRSATGPRI